MVEMEPIIPIETLAEYLPCLLGKPGVSPWDACRLDGWAASAIPSHGERVTAKFLLACGIRTKHGGAVGST